MTQRSTYTVFYVVLQVYIKIWGNQRNHIKAYKLHIYVVNLVLKKLIQNMEIWKIWTTSVHKLYCYCQSTSTSSTIRRSTFCIHPRKTPQRFNLHIIRGISPVSNNDSLSKGSRYRTYSDFQDFRVYRSFSADSVRKTVKISF